MVSETNSELAQVGRILHFVYDDGKRLHCRPALVTAECPENGQPGLVNLAVFLDGFDLQVDTAVTENPLQYRWEPFVSPNHVIRVFRSWHWPRECSGMKSPAEPEVRYGQRYHHTHAPDSDNKFNCYACTL